MSETGLAAGSASIGQPSGPRKPSAYAVPTERQPTGFGDFNFSANLELIAITLLGALVAVARAIPSAVRAPVLVAGLAIWMCALVCACSVAVLRAGRTPSGARAASILGIAGIAIAAFWASELEVVRVLRDRPALVWHVDWRVALSHAQAIARTGGVDQTLDYPGVPLAYHVGPAWLAGAVDHLFGAGLTAVLFGLVPLLSVLSVAVAAVVTMQASGVPYRLASAAAAMGLLVPGAHFSLRKIYSSLPAALFDPEFWPIGLVLNLNSFFALAVGFSAIVLLTDRRSRANRMACGAIGLASVLLLKPQFFVGFGTLAGLLGIGRAIGVRPFAPRGYALLSAAVGAFALALLMRATDSPHPARFLRPVVAPGHTGYGLSDLVSLAAVLGIAAVAAWSVVPERWRQTEPQVCPPELLIGALASLFILAISFSLVSIPARPELVERARQLGWNGYKATTEQWNFAQALRPLRVVIVLGALGVLGSLAALRRRTATFVAAGALLFVLPMPLMLRDFARPLKGFVAAEDVGLYELLRTLSRDGSLLIASDLADPAQDFKRGLRAPLLSGYAGHRVFVANLNHHIYTPADAVERVRALKRFFGAAWSGWHDAWLRNTGITHVLVSDRCVPFWMGQSDLPLREVKRCGRWILYSVNLGATRGEDVADPSWTDLKPRYGTVGCLTGASYLPSDAGSTQ
jgi:hypothetical protein